MALPSVECFRGLDLLDQLTALYEALYDVALDDSLVTPECFKGMDVREQMSAYYTAIRAINVTPPEYFEFLQPDGVSRFLQPDGVSTFLFES